VALMRTVQDVVFDVPGQLVYFDCPEGRPTSVTSAEVFLWDVADYGTAETAIGTATVEANPATTLDGTAASGATSVPIAATTGVTIGRTYLVTGAASLQEWVEVDSITAADSVTVKHPLHNSYAIGASFQSTRIQATVDPTWVADLSNLTTDDVGPNPMYRIRWVYVVSGVTYVADTYFNLVRYAARHGVRPQDVDVMMPGWLDSLPTDHRVDQGRRLIDDAYREVRIDLHQIDLSASSVAEGEVTDELVRYKMLERGEWVKYFTGSGDAQRAEMSTKQYAARLDSLVRMVSRVPVRDSSGAATAIISTGLTRR
jgi:hypothetical protein